jgi:hypothetical protein
MQWREWTQQQSKKNPRMQHTPLNLQAFDATKLSVTSPDSDYREKDERLNWSSHMKGDASWVLKEQ